MTYLRQTTLRVAGVGLTWLYTLYRVHPVVWRLMARNYRPWMGRFARLHAWMTCQFAWLEVPAYRAHLQRGGWEFRWFRLGSYPPTDKQNYVAAYPEEQRCRRGELEIAGSVVDESSGSSGGRSTGCAAAGSCARCTRTWPASRRWSSRAGAGS
jgi:phenylacetate-CoA ligase